MKHLILLLLAMSFSTGVLAREGLMLGAGLGKGEIDLDDENFGSNADTDDEDSTKNALIGYRIGDGLAFELGYHDLGEFDIDNGTARFTGETDTTSFSALLGLPLSERFSIYGKAGLHRWSVETTSTLFGTRDDDEAKGTDPVYGAGIRGELNEFAALRLEYDVMKMSDDDSDADIGDYKVATAILELTL